MNNTFYFKRFCNTLKWNLAYNRQMWVKLTLGIAIALSICLILPIFGGRHHADADPYNMAGKIRVAQIVFYTVIILRAGSIFNNSETKQQRIAFLTLPASAFEKFIVRLLDVTVLQVISFCISFVIADLVFMLFCAIVDNSYGTSYGIHSVIAATLPKTAENIDFLFERFGGNTIQNIIFGLYCILAFIWVQSLYLLGGALFRRAQWLYTSVVIIICTIILIVALKKYFPDPVPKEIFLIGTIVFSLLITANYVLTYLIFKRMQVVNNKWINL